MKIGILGYGKEGKCAEKYFSAKGHEVSVFDNFTNNDLPRFGLNNFNLIMRSPSVHAQPGWSSVTKYFFAHCPCPIIGVTGTKGKGTTCSIITTLFEALGQKVWLVGNIGTPALEVLDQIQPDDIVVYEMSSFQLWDLEKSPHIAVVLGIEPDHLNVHDDYEDYINAKANITKYQTPADFCIYYKPNPDSKIIAKLSEGTRIPYPIKSARLQKMLDNLQIPGQHNRDNAEAAIITVATFYHQTPLEFMRTYPKDIKMALENFRGLPHRLQLVRTLNHVKYYDDNFATTLSSLTVALDAFSDRKIVLIVGGRDKTENRDLPEIEKIIKSPRIAKTILIGESGHVMAEHMPDITLAETLAEAIEKARTAAEELAQDLILADSTTVPEVATEEATEAIAEEKPKKRGRKPKKAMQVVEPIDQDIIVLMSPAAASFDMFENVYDRGDQFQKLVLALPESPANESADVSTEDGSETNSEDTSEAPSDTKSSEPTQESKSDK